MQYLVGTVQLLLHKKHSNEEMIFCEKVNEFFIDSISEAQLCALIIVTRSGSVRCFI